MKFKIFKYENVVSTNNTAISLIKKKGSISGCVYSHKQKSGKGTHGKKWISTSGNLFTSIFFPLNKNYPSFDEFSIINPVIISDVIKFFCKKKKINLKFPNDIFLNGKKICGILQEVITMKNKKFLIIGIGINVITNPKIKDKYEATNILFETKNKLKIIEIINLIIFSYEKFFIDIKKYNFSSFKEKAEVMALN